MGSASLGITITGETIENLSFLAGAQDSFVLNFDGFFGAYPHPTKPGRLYFYPFVCPRDITLSSLGVRVTTTTGSGNIDVSIYSNAVDSTMGHIPYQRIYSVNVSAATTGEVTATDGAGQSLVKGNVYWMSVFYNIVAEEPYEIMQADPNFFPYISLGVDINGSLTSNFAYVIEDVAVTGSIPEVNPATYTLNLVNSAPDEITSAIERIPAFFAYEA